MRRARQFVAAALAVWLASGGVNAGTKEKIALSELAERLPRRVAAKDGTPGDMVNFVLVGSRAQVKEALEKAGWVEVDRTKSEAALRAIWQTVQKKPYTKLPMSELYLFGRPQDYGYAHAVPLAVVAERHHFRLWKAPWKTIEGDTLWIGAGTHDTGFERDQRTGQITHRIDPQVDKERAFIRQSLDEAGQVAGSGYVTPPEPVREATTAHGGRYYSDGRVLLITLK